MQNSALHGLSDPWSLVTMVIRRAFNITPDPAKSCPTLPLMRLGNLVYAGQRDRASEVLLPCPAAR